MGGTYRHSDAQVSLRSECGFIERVDSNLKHREESPLDRGGCLQSCCKSHVCSAVTNL